MKRIGEILAAVVGLAGIWFSYQAFRHDAGGELTAWHQQRELYNNSRRTIFICIDDINADLSSLQVAPFFDNSSKYSIKDFSLTYTVESSNVECEPTGFYSKIDYNGKKSVFRYNFETLKPYTDTEPPFRNFKIRARQSRCSIETKATYDGANNPYIYNLDVWFLVVDRRNITEENWRLSCKKAIFDVVEDKEYDIYYYGDGKKDYVFDVNLANIIAEDIEDRKAVEHKMERKMERKEKQPDVKKKDETYIPKSTDIMPFAMREVNIDSFDLIKGEEGKPSLLRINYEPSEQGAWVVFAWKYKAKNGVEDYGTSPVYLAPYSSSCDIEIYERVRSVKKVVQAVADPSLKPVIVEKDADKAGYMKFTNPNRRLVCAYKYDKEKNQIWHTTVKWKGVRSIRFADDAYVQGSSDCAYETYLIPIKQSRLRHILLLLFKTVMFLLTVFLFVFVVDWFKKKIKEFKKSGWGVFDVETVLAGLFMIVTLVSMAGMVIFVVFPLI